MSETETFGPPELNDVRHSTDSSSAVFVVRRQNVRTEQRRAAAQSYPSVAAEELKNVRQ